MSYGGRWQSGALLLVNGGRRLARVILQSSVVQWQERGRTAMRGAGRREGQGAMRRRAVCGLGAGAAQRQEEEGDSAGSGALGWAEEGASRARLDRERGRGFQPRKKRGLDLFGNFFITEFESNSN